MSKTGAAKINTNTGPIWCHFSQKGDTLKLRRIVDGVIYELDSENSEIEERYTLAKCKQLLPKQDSYAIGATHVWADILSLLNDGKRLPETDVEAAPTDEPTLVPVTRLRKYYQSMKVLEKAFFAAIAEMYEKKPSLLEKLWNDSRQQFLAYENQKAWGQSKRESLPRFTGPLSDVSSTNEFTTFFMNHGLTDSGYEYVSREINPWNTRQGVFATGLRATKTGRGGMDLLLRSADGLPVVAEVKVRDDKNCFFALLQALTYAVELSTPNQIKRLQLTFPDAFPALSPSSPVEVAVIMVNPVPDATRNTTTKLIQSLNRRNRCRGLGRVRVFQNSKERWKSGQ